MTRTARMAMHRPCRFPAVAGRSAHALVSHQPSGLRGQRFEAIHLEQAECQADPSFNDGKQTVPCMPFKDYYAARFTGNLLLDLTTPGTPETCHFRMTSDDGAVLYINGTKVVDDDGVHGMQSRIGSIELRESNVYLPFRLPT